ncbi:hypothetical protein Sjap_008516 [Stephania japonica]|uniref:Translation initiation factor eIF2B subunit epsilon n=1 Tax=Stephania japonica TaxID=461633 RepID=A0AAP0JPS6_9MAGN
MVSKMVQKKGGRVSEDPENLATVRLQAVLLADSFATKFRPITFERPKVLLPLVNVPMIDYSLHWLESAGVEEVFVFCCAHAKQVINYLNSSHWLSIPSFTVTTIESNDAISAGDALRLIYERNVIRGDFVLISGDTVSNMSLTQALQEHKERRKKDSDAVMTMVIKKSKPCQFICQTRLGTDELFMAIDPSTKQLLHYEENSDNLKGSVVLDKTLVAENPSVSLLNDMQDCYIDICSPEVLSLFTDNFDYQHLRRHFVKGLLVDDIMGYKIFTHEIHSEYAARVDNFKSYDTISKDIMQRWTYPMVPDVQFSGNHPAKLERQGIYKASETPSLTAYPLSTIISGSSSLFSSFPLPPSSSPANFKEALLLCPHLLGRPFVADLFFTKMKLISCLISVSVCAASPEIVPSQSAQIGPFTFLGKGSNIGDFSKITNSVIGEGCSIGSNVSIEGSYIWNNVIIHDGCKLKHAIVCDGAVIKSGAVLEPGVILSFKVVIGQQFVVPAYSKVSLIPQPINQDSDEELEYADNCSAVAESPSVSTSFDIPNGELTVQSADVSEVGISGVGYIWSACEAGHEEEWRHSVAPIPQDKLEEVVRAALAELDLVTQESSQLPASGELKPGSETANSLDGENEEAKDDSIDFEREVEATFLRAVHEGVEQEHVILEMNSLRVIMLSNLLTLFQKINPTVYELHKNVATVVTKWGGLLQHYLQTDDEQARGRAMYLKEFLKMNIEVILKFEEMCLESMRDFSSLFAQEPLKQIPTELQWIPTLETSLGQLRMEIQTANVPPGDRVSFSPFLGWSFKQVKEDAVEILHLLYDKDILSEDAILSWASEKEGGDEADKIFIKQSEVFIQWLKEASEEED